MALAEVAETRLELELVLAAVLAATDVRSAAKRQVAEHQQNHQFQSLWVLPTQSPSELAALAALTTIWVHNQQTETTQFSQPLLQLEAEKAATLAQAPLQVVAAVAAAQRQQLKPVAQVRPVKGTPAVTANQLLLFVVAVVAVLAQLAQQPETSMVLAHQTAATASPRLSQVPQSLVLAAVVVVVPTRQSALEEQVAQEAAEMAACQA